MLYINTKVLSRIKYKLHGWEIWGNDETKDIINKRLVQIYVRIFSVHINADDMVKWTSLDWDTIKIKSCNIIDLLNLPLLDQILD